MNEQQKRLVPTLRFPEFREADGWVPKRLGSVGQLTRGLTYSAGDVAPAGLLVLRSTNIQDGSLVLHQDLVFVGKQCPKALRLQAGDIVICMSNGSKTLVGKSGEYSGEYEGDITVGAFCSFFRPEFPFAKIAFHLNSYQKYIADLIAGGNINNLTNSVLEEFFFAVPPSPAEQQKIADCLSSLDELIAAQARKVEALKTHKKGLMQQLFPREGETQPRLRFPEFRDSGAWFECELGTKVMKVGSGITPAGGDKNYKVSGRPFVRSQNVGWGVLLLDDVAFIDEKTHASFESTEIKVRDVLLNITGASIGRNAVADERIAAGNVNQHVCIIRTKPDELDSLFLNQFLISQSGQKQIDNFQAGGNRQGLNFAQIRSFAVPLPPKLPEQQRIADCLTTLDTLITAATQELDALKTHKKGLMQQIFPSVEATQA